MRKPHWKKHRRIVNFLAVMCGVLIIGGITFFMLTDNAYGMVCFLFGLPGIMILSVLNKKGWI